MPCAVLPIIGQITCKIKTLCMPQASSPSCPPSSCPGGPSHKPNTQTAGSHKANCIRCQASGSPGIWLLSAGTEGRREGELVDKPWYQAQQHLSSLPPSIRVWFPPATTHITELTYMNGSNQTCCKIICTHHVVGFRQVATLLQKNFHKHGEML